MQRQRDETREANIRLRSELNTKDHSIERLNEALTEIRRLDASSSGANAEATVRLERAGRERDELRAQVHSLRVSLSEAARKVSHLESVNSSLTKKQDEAISRLHGQLEVILGSRRQSDAGEAKARLSERKEGNERSEKERISKAESAAEGIEEETSLDMSVSSSEAHDNTMEEDSLSEIGDIEKKETHGEEEEVDDEAFEALESRMTAIKREISDLRAEAEQMRQLLAEKNAEIDQLRSQLERASSEVVKGKQLQDELRRLNEEKASLNARNETLLQQLRDARAAVTAASRSSGVPPRPGEGRPRESPSRVEHKDEYSSDEESFSDDDDDGELEGRRRRHGGDSKRFHQSDRELLDEIRQLRARLASTEADAMASQRSAQRASAIAEAAEKRLAEAEVEAERLSKALAFAEAVVSVDSAKGPRPHETQRRTKELEEQLKAVEAERDSAKSEADTATADQRRIFDEMKVGPITLL